MEQYQLWKSMIREGLEVPFGAEFYVKFYQAFIENDRWLQYIKGVGTTLLVTAMALGIGIVLGILVAMLLLGALKLFVGIALATINPIIGAYNNRPIKEIITIVDNQEYRRLMEYMKKTDPKAFVTVYSVSHIIYQPKKRA